MNNRKLLKNIQSEINSKHPTTFKLLEILGLIRQNIKISQTDKKQWWYLTPDKKPISVS
jgi:hypothetical protein